MLSFTPRAILLITVLLVLLASIAYSFLGSSREVDYITDVKPILNKKCISCHGGVKKQGGFSLLFHEEALAPTRSGKPAIIPGDADGSEMIRRLVMDDPEERMPYKHDPLSKEEIGILKDWIDQGAKWGNHWAYLPVKKVEVPDSGNEWARNDIDRFIYEGLEKPGLVPSAQADPATLLRRLSLDLIGMLPSEKTADAFLKAKGSDRAYERLVDSLLASPRFGERWASMWLDIARYADTKGYESDGHRNIWQYRDWVIRAFNADKPYNTFITEQIAGDLLPNPTDDQFIATAFQRNSPSNDEGGTNNEEFRVSAVMDRVNTTWEGMMSTTFACVQCHSHPYDPFRHDEYYRFMAYFNNTRDEDVSPEYPLFKSFSDSAKTELGRLTAWLKVNAPDRAREISFFIKTGQPAINSTTADSLDNCVIGNNNISLFFRSRSSARLKNVDLDGADQLILNYNPTLAGGKMSLHLDAPNGPVFASWRVELMHGKPLKVVKFPPQKGIHDVFISYQTSGAKDPLETVLYFDWFYFGRQFPGKGKPGYEENEKRYWSLIGTGAPTTPILLENPMSMFRKTYVFDRGAWTSPGREVQAGVPAIFSYAMPEGAPQNRLGLSMWLTDKQNPLVSRTMVNRLWEQLFGTGIVETLEDMGTQGIAPTHRELLDHLAYRFMNENRWSVKKLLREMVMSAAYRQDSRLTDELRDKDPLNKYYARGPRVRLSAEQVRDQHLSVCDALSIKMYGEGVMPWQPEGIWLSPYSGARWNMSKGEDQYRRAVYTYWKRTAPYPSMINFDAAQRQVCSARRIRTNTPLQALVTLNDSVYVDIARHFARKMIKKGGNTVQARIGKGYEWILYKPISPRRLDILNKLYGTALQEFRKQPAKAAEMMGAPEQPAKAEEAAMVVVANAMLNLDEVVTKN